MIFEWEKMEQLVGKSYLETNYDMPVFCEKHRVIGGLKFREGGPEGLQEVVKKRKPSEKPQSAAMKKAIFERIQKRREEMTIALKGH